MVGHFLLETQPHEAPKAQPIAERLFQLRVRQRVPLLQQQRAQHQQRPVRRTAFASGVNRTQQLLDSAPVQKRADALQPLVLSLAPSHHRIRQAHLLALAPPHPRPRLPRTYLLFPVASPQAVLLVFHRNEPCVSDRQWTPVGSSTSVCELELQPDPNRTAPSKAAAI